MIAGQREHLLQSAAWGEVKSAWGRPAVRAGGAQYTVHRLAAGLAQLGYAPRVAVEGLDLAALARSATELGCAFVRIEPNHPLRAPTGLRLRRSRGPLGRASWIIDLAGGTEALWPRLRKNTRAHIRESGRRGAVVRVGAGDDLLADFIAIQRITDQRHGLGSRPDRYYRLIRDVFGGAVRIVNAYHDDECLASEMLVAHDHVLYDLYGGTSGTQRQLMGSYAAIWRGLDVAGEMGCDRFDFWSALAPDEQRPDHPWYGFHQFKAGFGGTLVEYPGAYDLVLRPKAYAVLAVGERLRRVARRIKSRIARERAVEPARPAALEDPPP